MTFSSAQIMIPPDAVAALGASVPNETPPSVPEQQPAVQPDNSEAAAEGERTRAELQQPSGTAMVPTWYDRLARPSVRTKLTLVVVSLLVFNITIDALGYLISWQNKQGLERLQLDQMVLQDALALHKHAHGLQGKHGEPIDREQLDAFGLAYVQLMQSVRGEAEFRERLGQDDPTEQRIAAAIGERVRELIQSEGDGSSAIRSAPGEPSPTLRDRHALLEGIEALAHELVTGETREFSETIEQEKELSVLIDRVMISAIVVSTLSALISIIILLRAVRVPLATLTAGAATFGAGRLEHRIAIGGTDEFAKLATTMNDMAAELARRRRVLEIESSMLQDAVDRRTLELTRSNEKLEAAFALRRRFLAEIGHELRTPLTVIRGECEVVLRDANSGVGDYHGALTCILEQTSHTTSLVNDLLFVAASEAGRAPLAEEAVDFGGLARDVGEQLQAVATMRGLRLTVYEAGLNGHGVFGDAKHLKRLLLILIENAMVYSPAGKEIAVRINGEQKLVRLVVEDRGAGIEPDEQLRVFERFYRGANATDLYPGGSGLGLPMAKAIVEAHGGDIRLESRLGHGTTVVVELPAIGGEHEIR